MCNQSPAESNTSCQLCSQQAGGDPGRVMGLELAMHSQVICLQAALRCAHGWLAATGRSGPSAGRGLEHTMLPQMLDHIICTFFPAIWRAPAGSLREVRCLLVLPQGMPARAAAMPGHPGRLGHAYTPSLPLNPMRVTIMMWHCVAGRGRGDSRGLYSPVGCDAGHRQQARHVHGVL